MTVSPGAAVARSPHLVGARLNAVCAWCEHDSRGETRAQRLVPPDDRPTHGICPRHEQEILASVPSRSFPGVEILIVVEPGEPELYRQLARATRGLPGVAVILDRRMGPRRSAGSAVAPPRERRHGDRRRRRPIASGPGYTVVRLGPPRR